jgi:hypothetical protein
MDADPPLGPFSGQHSYLKNVKWRRGELGCERERECVCERGSVCSPQDIGDTRE